VTVSATGKYEEGLLVAPAQVVVMRRGNLQHTSFLRGPVRLVPESLPNPHRIVPGRAFANDDNVFHKKIRIVKKKEVSKRVSRRVFVKQEKCFLTSAYSERSDYYEGFKKHTMDSGGGIFSGPRTDGKPPLRHG
jgi:hypothetical protein